MSEEKNLTLVLNENEWEFIKGEAHFLSKEPEQLIVTLIKNEIIDRKRIEQSLYENEKIKESYNSFVLALDYYLSVAVKEAIQLEDKKMEQVLSTLRDDYIQKHSTVLKLFEQYNTK